MPPLASEQPSTELHKASTQIYIISRSMVFEKAYCLYRLNKTQEALAVLNKEPNPEAKHKELKAQILYRLEKYRGLCNTHFLKTVIMI